MARMQPVFRMNRQAPAIITTDSHLPAVYIHRDKTAVWQLKVMRDSHKVCH